MRKGSVSHAEVARILVEDGRQDAVADDVAVEGVQIGRSRALAIALDSPSESFVVIHGLVITGNHKCGGEGHRISRRAKGEAHLLPRGHGSSVAAIGDVELGQHSYHSLLLLLLDLLFGLVVLTLIGSRRLRGDLRTRSALIRWRLLIKRLG